MSAKPKKNIENSKNNNNQKLILKIKNKNSRSKRNIYDSEQKAEQKNRVTEHLKKYKEKPIKLFINSNENEKMAIGQMKNKDKKSNKKSEEIKNNNKKRSPDRNDRNSNNNHLKNRNKLKIDVKFPAIVKGAISPVHRSKNMKESLLLHQI